MTRHTYAHNPAAVRGEVAQEAEAVGDRHLAQQLALVHDHSSPMDTAQRLPLKHCEQMRLSSHGNANTDLERYRGSADEWQGRQHHHVPRFE
jgi:hypothetical protein